MSTSSPTSESPPSARAATVEANLAAQNELDLDAFLATFSTPRLELIGTGRVFDGTEALSTYFNESRHAIPDQRRELIELHAAERAVVAEFWFSGTLSGSLPELVATGREFKIRVASVYEFDETPGITCARSYFDMGTIVRQLA